MDELPKEQIFDTIRKYGYRIFEEEYMSAYMMDLFPKEKKLRGLIEQARSAGVYSRLMNIYKSCGDDRGKIRRAAEREVQVLMDDCFLDRQYAAFCVDIFLCLENENIGLIGSVPAQKQECGMTKKAERPKMKIYPNDPCPCGSGKKYKNCCGRIGDSKDSRQEKRPKLFQDPWNQTAYEKTRMKSMEAFLRGIKEWEERTGVKEINKEGFPWDYPCGCGSGRNYKDCHGKMERYLIDGEYYCPCGSGDSFLSCHWKDAKEHNFYKPIKSKEVEEEEIKVRAVEDTASLYLLDREKFEREMENLVERYGDKVEEEVQEAIIGFMGCLDFGELTE